MFKPYEIGNYFNDFFVNKVDKFREEMMFGRTSLPL